MPGKSGLHASGEGDEELSYEIDYENSNYTMKIKRISLHEMAVNSDIIDAQEYEGSLIAIYLFDETALRLAIEEVDNQSLAAGLIYLDNYEEALDSVEEVRRSLLNSPESGSSEVRPCRI